VEPPGAAERGLPALADQIAIRALADDPNERYQSASELHAALLQLCARMGGRLSQAEIKTYMDERFGAERAREEREIDQALQAERVTPARGTDADVGGFTKQVRRNSERPRADSTPDIAPSQRTLHRRGRVWALVAVALLGGAIAAKLLAPAATEPAKAAQASDSADAKAAPPSSAQTAMEPPRAEPEPDAPATPSARPRPASRTTKLGKAERATPAKPAGTATSGSRGLPLDRQDPWAQ
jgi:serine/threonine-protein kinase